MTATHLADLLAGNTTVTAMGTKVTASRWGHAFVVLNVDRAVPWPADAATVLAPLAADLAVIARYRRNRPVTAAPPQWTAAIYTPDAIAAQILNVMLAADAGNLEPARRAATAVRPVAAEVLATATQMGRRAVAITAVTAVEDRVRQALGGYVGVEP